MQQEERVLAIKRELDDMLEKNTLNKRRLLDLLEKLNSADVDTELLQRTQVGRTVNDIRKVYSTSKDINQKATKLIKQWKHLVKTEHETRRMSISSVKSEDSVTPSEYTGSNGDREGSNQFSPFNPGGGDDHAYFHASTVASSASSNRANDDGPPPAKIRRSDSASSTSSTLNSTDCGLLSPLPNPEDDTRIKSVELLRQALLSGDQPPPKPHPAGKNSRELAIEIERHIYAEVGNATDRHYKARIRSRVTNLRDKKNTALRNNVLMGILSTRRLAAMSVDELANDQLKQLRRSLEEESIRSREIGGDTSSARSDMYLCEQCDKRDTSYSVTQERVEGDYEPVAITQVVCNVCGHRWRVY